MARGALRQARLAEHSAQQAQRSGAQPLRRQEHCAAEQAQVQDMQHR